MHGRFTATAMLAVLIAAVPAEVSAVEPTPLDVFRRYYKEQQPELRLKAVAQLAGERGGPVVEALLLAAADEDRQVRERAASLLEDRRDRPDEIAAIVRVGLGKQPPEIRVLAVHALAVAGIKAKAELRAALSDAQSEVRRVAALSIAHLGDVDAAPKLSELLTAKEPLVRAAAIEGLGVLLGEEAVGPATAVVLGDRSPEPRIAAVEILGAAPRPQTAEAAARCLLDESWSVRVAATRALALFHVDAPSARAAAGPLVRRLADEPRIRVKLEIAAALFSLTGIDFGPEPDRWSAWLQEAGATFTPPVRRPQRAKPDAHATSGHLLDLPIDSDHVSFVLDCSHSMGDPLRFGAEQTKRDALVKSLELVFAKLPPTSRFNLVPFGTDPRPYKPALFAATPQAKKSAMSFFEKCAPDGRTNIYDSLAIALADPDADTVVLLTDGAPTEGACRTRVAILAGIRRLDRYRLARIHAVEVGALNTSPRWKGFMQEIADATGGTYQSR